MPIPPSLEPLLRAAVNEAREAGGPDAYLLAAAGRAEPVSATTASAWWAKLLKLAVHQGVLAESDLQALDVRYHGLRHAAITDWITAHVPIKTCQRWSGHRSTAQLLDVYAGCFPEEEPFAGRLIADHDSSVKIAAEPDLQEQR